MRCLILVLFLSFVLDAVGLESEISSDLKKTCYSTVSRSSLLWNLARPEVTAENQKLIVVVITSE